MEGNTVRIERDVVSPEGDRLTIFVAKFWRPMLAEFNTHRSHSRSSASSRAIPVVKQMSMIEAQPARPVHWGAEQPGMQSGGQLDGFDLRMAERLIDGLEQMALDSIRQYLDLMRDLYGDDAKAHTLHKSLLNRYMEPFMWHTIIFAATDDGWDNFFKQRSTAFTTNAQREFSIIADQMYDLMLDSRPQAIGYGDWVLPFIQPDDEFDLDDEWALQKISTARCARVSYLNHEGVRDPAEDLRMFEERLFAPDPRHVAPSEFVATPFHPDFASIKHQGNFTGWTQFRHLIERWPR